MYQIYYHTTPEKWAQTLGIHESTDLFILMGLARRKNNRNLARNEQAVIRKVVNGTNFVREYWRMGERLRNFVSEDISPDDFNIYLSFNPRCPHKAYKMLRKQFAEWDYQKDDSYERKLCRIDSHWMSCLQKPQAKRERNYFLIDIDSKDKVALHEDIQVVERIKTRNGQHLLTKPFDANLVKDQNEIELFKDGMTQIGRIEKVD